MSGYFCRILDDMNRNSGAVFVCCLVVLIAFLHISALQFYLYWSLWWFDILMHFLGGAWVAAAVLWCLLLSGYVHTRWRPFRTAVCLTIIVGILWEIYEYAFGMTLVEHEAYVFDTALDLVMDMIGAITLSPLFISLVCKKQA